MASSTHWGFIGASLFRLSSWVRVSVSSRPISLALLPTQRHSPLLQRQGHGGAVDRGDRDSEDKSLVRPEYLIMTSGPQRRLVIPILGKECVGVMRGGWKECG